MYTEQSLTDTQKSQGALYTRIYTQKGFEHTQAYILSQGP